MTVWCEASGCLNPAKRNARFCSDVCQGRAWRNRARDLSCDECGTTLQRPARCCGFCMNLDEWREDIAEYERTGEPA